MMIILRPSSAGRWTRCALSAHLEQSDRALQENQHPAAAEGTCAAWVAEVIINGDATCVEDMIGKVHKNGVEVTEDMARHLEPYVQMAQSRSAFQAEVFLSHTADDGSFMLQGTSDLHSKTTDQDYHIDDLKLGFGIIEPDSKQLLAYAMLAYLNGVRAERWHLGIFQPRAMHDKGPYRTITYTQDQIVALFTGLYDEARAIAAHDPVARPGDHCDHCLAAHICTALTHSVYAMWAPIESRTYIEPTNQQLADELSLMKRFETMIEARKAAVEAEITGRLRANQMIPGWAIMPQPGMRKFKYAIDVIEAMTGVDAKNVKICTPAELERRGASKVTVEALAFRPVVGYKLQPYDPSRVAALFQLKEQ